MLPLYVYARGFAVALFGIGLLQLVFRSVLIGRPADLLENDIFAAAVSYPVSITLFAVAVQLFLGNVTRWLFGGVTIFLFVYSGLSNLFAVVYHIDYGMPLTSFGKSITLASGIWFLYTATAGSLEATSAFNVARICMGLFLAISGVQHFLFFEFARFLVPRWIPFDAFWTYAAGVALIVCGLSLIFRFRIYLIAFLGGCMIFIWFLILHIPRGIAEPNANELAAVCESLAVSMILFALARTDAQHPIHPYRTSK